MNRALFTSTSASVGAYNRVSMNTTTKTVGRYKPSPTDFIGSFYAVLHRWRSEIAFISDPDKIAEHPSFKALVTNADLVLPLIIDELRKEPSYLVWVLDDAFDEHPYLSSQIGNLTEMSNAWIAWAERNGRTL
jgi:hypothetical protein